MSRKVAAFAAIIVLIIVAAGVIFQKTKLSAPKSPVEESPVKLDITIEEISLPTVIKGFARGYWFFEAQFPVEVISESGETIGTGVARADGDWMTESFVPFAVKLSGKTESAVRANIFFLKSNPSGLPKNSDSVSFPVTITPPEELKQPENTIALRAYFSVEGEDDCSKVQYVDRIIPRTEGVAKAALLELLKGPGVTDAKLLTNINPEAKLNSVTIKGSIAYADFNSGLNRNIGGSCRVAAIRAQITETLKQFPTIKEVVISVNGETEAILEP